MRIVTDYDGTFSHIVQLLKSDDKVLVITGQHPNFWKDSHRTAASCLNKHWWDSSIKFKGYPDYKNTGQPTQFTDVVLNDIANWKADMVREFNADYFFDDDLRVITIVKARCPDTICCLVV